MIRAWAGVALLACSWLPGLGFYAPASPFLWIVTVVLGAALLAEVPVPMPPGREAWIAAALCLVAAWLLPWPHRAAPLLIAGAMVLPMASPNRRWPSSAGRGMVSAALVLLAQSVLIWLYSVGTARSHDLPWPLARLLGEVVRLLGLETAVDASDLAVFASGKVHHIGLTWDLLLDPVTLAFLVGGIVVLAILTYPASAREHRQSDKSPPLAVAEFVKVRDRREPRGPREDPRSRAPSAHASLPVAIQHPWAALLRPAGLLVLAVAAWAPVRAGLVLGLLVQRIFRAGPEPAHNVMEIVFSPWLHLVLLAGPVFLAWRLVPGSAARPDEPVSAPPIGSDARPRRTPPASLALAAVGTAILAFLFHWEGVGTPKAGRVMVVERHSTWEPTTRPYDTQDYGEPASYTYAAIYDYCSRYYTMSRLLEAEPIDRQALDRCDVLVIKTPTAAYLPGEVAAVADFVQRGGGLLLIGEHTDVFKSSTYLNQVAEPFKFQFRKDLLFRVSSPYVQEYEPRAVPHPVVQNLPPMHFAVSCSIDPGSSRGRAVVRSAGLWSLPPAYHTENYFPEAEYRTDMRYGAFVQLWAARHGRGRVLAWTDSTIFSNFSAFEPGKAELMLGMIQWLNHRSILDNTNLRLPVYAIVALAGLLGIAAGLRLSFRQGPARLALAAAALAGWTVGSSAAAAAQRIAMPPPQPVRPMVRIVVDRTVSEVPLARGGFTRRDGRGYGLLEQWIPRLGYFTARRSGLDALTGDGLLVICPTRSVSPQYRQGLIDYVAAGGKLLVIDSPDSSGSTANSLLWPFGLSMDHSAAPAGRLHGKDSWPDIPVESACVVDGGEPLLWVGETQVAARTTYAKGTVIAIGLGSIFNDAGMGLHWMAEPDEPTRTRFELWYWLVRALIEGAPLEHPPRDANRPPLSMQDNLAIRSTL